MSLSIYRRRTRRPCSIVDLLNSRSVTGRLHGLEIHHHSRLQIVLCWNIHNITGCFGNCITRSIVDKHGENQLENTFRCTFGRAGGTKSYCKFTSSYGVKKGEPCIYMGYLAWERRISREGLWRHWDYPEFTCRCVGPSSWAITRHQPMTLFSLKNGRLTLLKKNYPTVKRILDRLDVSIDRKFQNRSVIRVKCPIIFTSNDRPYYDPAFMRRVQVVEAVESLENVEKVRCPKLEVDGPEEEMEVVEISTDEESEVDEETEVPSTADTSPNSSTANKTVLEKRKLWEITNTTSFKI